MPVTVTLVGGPVRSSVCPWLPNGKPLWPGQSLTLNSPPPLSQCSMQIRGLIRQRVYLCSFLSPLPLPIGSALGAAPCCLGRTPPPHLPLHCHRNPFTQQIRLEKGFGEEGKRGRSRRLGRVFTASDFGSLPSSRARQEVEEFVPHLSGPTGPRVLSFRTTSLTAEENQGPRG